MMMFGQARIFFVMARDGLLPDSLAAVHPKWRTPHRMTIITGLFVAAGAALLPVGQLFDISNAGTLFAFLLVAISVMVLRVRDPHRLRPFRTPAVFVVGPLAAFGCVFLYCSLPWANRLVLPIWGAAGLLVYFAYGYRRSHIARGPVEVHELDTDAPPQPVSAIQEGR
jgi:APA family basic amino acid/polyamine antiporter